MSDPPKRPESLPHLQLLDPSRPDRAVPLTHLVEALLVARTDGLDAPQVAAFLSGWTSALELVRRVDLTLPDASDEVRQAITSLAAAIDMAQSSAVEEDEQARGPAGPRRN